MKHSLTGTALSLVWAALLHSPANAQVQADVQNDESAFDSETIIVTANRLGAVGEDRLTVPASVLTEAELSARGQQYVADVLRSLPGIAVSQSGAASGITQIRVRGAEANQVLVLIDGVEVANPSSGEFDLSGLRAADLVKIEVLRGEQSALYGSDAVAGVINIVTRAGEGHERYRASVEAGSRGTIEGQLSAVIPVGEAALSINGNAFDTNGYDISGLGGEKDGSDSRSLNIGLNKVQLGGLRFDAKYGASVLNVEFDEDAPFNGRLDDTNSQTQVKTQTARGDVRFGTGSIDHKIGVGYLQTDTDTRAAFSSRSVGERIKADWIAKASAETSAGQHSLTLLGEYERETYRTDPNFTEPGAKPENETAAIAADYRFDRGALTLSASARHDVNDLFDDATTWRLGGAYGFAWNGRLRASVGSGIKNPTMIELFGFNPASNFTGNPNLKPERSIGVSAGYEQTIGNFTGSVDVFYSELENEIATSFLPPTFAATVVNLPTDSTRQGIELEARYTAGTVSVSGSATILDSEENGISEIRRPEFTASAMIDWQATDALRLSAFADHTGSQTDTDFATFANVELDAFTLVGAKAEFGISEHVNLSLRGENLLDEDYQEIVGYASPGRAVFAGLALDF